MALYRLHAKAWEADIRAGAPNGRRTQTEKRDESPAAEGEDDESEEAGLSVQLPPAAKPSDGVELHLTAVTPKPAKRTKRPAPSEPSTSTQPKKRRKTAPSSGLSTVVRGVIRPGAVDKRSRNTGGGGDSARWWESLGTGSKGILQI